MESEVSTKKQLLSLVDDVDLVIRQLFDTLSQQSSQNTVVNQVGSGESETQSHVMDVGQLTDLLLQKNKKLADLTEVACQQQKLEVKVKATRAEIAMKDTEIKCLQKHLKAAEQLLGTALHQAKEKLKSFDQANKGSVMSEDIIKYAHKISASCSTAAPLNWTPGDQRRPYPQDIEMRCGWLGQINNSDMNVKDPMLKPPAQLGTDGIQMPSFSSNSQWQKGNQSMDMSTFTDGRSTEDVDVMSSDSSSSDSSDSSGVND
uniref:mediator of RNA polymerase II transcription subunit 4-like isoform X1 n=1 Tax=Ciona intestinalis TaxID=7719 RepID=UPI0000520ECC|nr:mediator of RNA polymerase II transcription subunit 4-like isoform X1 [Ciona intestinalis]|eukprot:XP_002127402.1 mediator of RNA polymerase II transcription subunit 4-like isoform X1 [Ciona intestinalis]